MTKKGIAASPGIAIGRAYVLKKEEFSILEYKINKEEINNEIKRFKEAVKQAKYELERIRKKAKEKIGEKEAYIFQAHLYILEDPLLIDETEKKIRKEKLNAEASLEKTLQLLPTKFASVQAEIIRERFRDIEDVGRRIMRNLLNKPTFTLLHLKEKAIIIASDLAPSDTISMEKGKILGFATNIGGRTSHTAIIARSLEIPAVVGLRDITEKAKVGSLIILDGNKGRVIINPSLKQLANYQRTQKEFLHYKEKLITLRSLPPQTLDGREIELAVNIAGPEEINLALRDGAEGVGLYRTEYLYMNRSVLPNEEEQLNAYKDIARRMFPYSVIIRTIDLGGDKFLSHFPVPQQMNPFMGWRAIRLCLEKVDIFKEQLKAILRATNFGKVKIMYPMISGVEEIKKANKILSEVKKELKKEQIPFAEDIEVGIMVEVPSAAITADILAKKVDFFSLGTNDLIQYSLAVDRVNEKVAYLYQPLHPTVLRLIDNVVKSAHRQGIWVGACGEMASNPLFALILLGLGIDELSVAPTSLLEIKKVIRGVNWEETQRISAELLKMTTSSRTKRYVQTKLSKKVKDILMDRNL